MIPRTLFDSEHEQFRESFRRFLEAEAVPHYDQWEKDGEIDRSLWTKAGAQGYLCPTVSEAYGGAGADYRYNVIVGEELSDLGMAGVGFILHSDIVVPYIENVGNEAQKQKFLPKCIESLPVLWCRLHNGIVSLCGGLRPIPVCFLI